MALHTSVCRICPKFEMEFFPPPSHLHSVVQYLQVCLRSWYSFSYILRFSFVWIVYVLSTLELWRVMMRLIGSCWLGHRCKTTWQNYGHYSTSSSQTYSMISTGMLIHISHVKIQLVYLHGCMGKGQSPFVEQFPPLRLGVGGGAIPPYWMFGMALLYWMLDSPLFTDLNKEMLLSREHCAL